MTDHRDHESEPMYFSFIDSAIIWTHRYDGLPTNEFGKKIYLIEFASLSLEDPKSEPIAVYHYAGSRRYFWRDAYWSEYDISGSYLEDRTKELLQEEKDREMILNYTKLLGMIEHYIGRSWVTPESGLGRPSKRPPGLNIPFSGLHFATVVYRLRH